MLALLRQMRYSFDFNQEFFLRLSTEIMLTDDLS